MPACPWSPSGSLSADSSDPLPRHGLQEIAAFGARQARKHGGRLPPVPARPRRLARVTASSSLDPDAPTGGSYPRDRDPAHGEPARRVYLACRRATDVATPTCGAVRYGVVTRVGRGGWPRKRPATPLSVILRSFAQGREGKLLHALEDVQKPRGGRAGYFTIPIGTHCTKPRT